MVQPFQKVWELLSLADPCPACAIVTGLSEGFGSWKASVLWQRETWRLKHELEHTTWYLVVPSAIYLQQLHCRGCPVATAMPGIFVVPTSDVAVSTPLRMTTHIPWLRRFHTGPFADGEHITFAVASGKWWIPFFLPMTVWSFLTSELDWKILKLYGSPATMWLFGHLT